MNNLKLINSAWELREQGIISLHEHDLYCYLVYRCEKIGRNPFNQPTEVLCAMLSVNRNALVDRRTKLSGLGLISFREGVSKGKPARYYICGMDKKKLDSQPDLLVDKNVPAFDKPTLTEVTTYCIERNNDINPQLFYDYYQSKDWFVGKNKMWNWQAAIRMWEANKREDKRASPKNDNNITYVQF